MIASTIATVIFDLDGTLVQTEQLKARSYARAAVELRPEDIDEEEVVEAYGDVVGRSREEIAETLMRAFDLEEAAAAHAQTLDGDPAPWEAFVKVRFGYYHDLIGDAETVRAQRCPQALALLQEMRRSERAVALATTSEWSEAEQVLEALGIAAAFDAVATADEVEHTKPDPEVYRLLLRQLETPPERALAIEDSPAGVRAAQAAGVHCVAVPTAFTREALAEADLLDPRFVADDPAQLLPLVRSMLKDARQPEAAS